MTRTSKLALRFAALAMLVIAPAALAEPPSLFNLHARPPRSQRPQRVQQPGFQTMGVYGGQIGDQVLIDGTPYLLRQKTQPYLVGRGLISMSEIPIGSSVFATIVGTPQSGVVWQLIVRPADEDRGKREDMTRPATLRSESAPR